MLTAKMYRSEIYVPNFWILLSVCVLFPAGFLATDGFFRDNVVCPSGCENAKNPIRCCTCDTTALWEFFPVEQLMIEYTSRYGNSLSMYTAQSNSTLNTTLIHKHGFMSKIPDNMCDFLHTVKIDLSYNSIDEIGNISCLTMLDTLILTHNRIKVVTNDTFRNLDFLRVLKLSNNMIHHLDPRTLSQISQGILQADFSLNRLKTVDFTNFVLDKPFCDIIFKNNNITKMTNELGFTLDSDSTYGEGGMVILSGNEFTSWMNFTELGVPDLSLLSKLFSFGFDLRDAKWNCDCLMEPMLEIAYDFFQRNWRDYMNITCYKPDYLHDQGIPMLHDERKLDLFVCDYSNTSKCPFPCNCIEQPSQKRIIVTCTDKNIREIPLINISSDFPMLLHYSENRIKKLRIQKHFQKISFLNLSYNDITSLDDDELTSIENAEFVDLKYNKIFEISKRMERMDPCKVEFGSITVHCTCQSLWLREWQKNHGLKSCKTVNNFTCKTSKGFISALHLTSEYLNCFPWDPIPFTIAVGFSVAIFIGAITGFIYNIYQIELILIKRNLIRNRKTKYQTKFKFDVYISIDDNVDDLRFWTIRVLAKELQMNGYRVFLPCRDLLPGDFQEENMNNSISNSKNFLLILSESHFNSEMPWSRLEWKYMWNLFLQDVSRKIIVVNFDQLETAEIDQREVKAFSRLGLMLDFTQLHGVLLEEIKFQLGIPINRFFVLPERNLKNAKVLFNRKSLLRV